MASYKTLTETNCKDFKNFKYSEFKCKCGGKYCNGYPVAFSYDLANNLQKIRNYYGKPLTITSALRCKQHNKNEGGVSDSKHLDGCAADFKVEDVSADKLLTYVKKLPYYRYAYVVSKSKGVVHLDITPPKPSTKKAYSGTYPKLPSRGYFRKGDKGTEVKNLQKLLNWLNSAKLSIDGIIGDKTIAEVKKFQKSVKISCDGLFGKNSLAKAKTVKK